jgi:hypothetical protein
LGDHLTTEGFGEDGGFEAVEEGAGSGGFGFEAVGAGERGIEASTKTCCL